MCFEFTTTEGDNRRNVDGYLTTHDQRDVKIMCITAAISLGAGIFEQQRL